MPKQQRSPVGAQANSYVNNCRDVRVVWTTTLPEFVSNAR